MNKKILIRADADCRKGMGHLIRQLNLASKLKTLGVGTEIICYMTGINKYIIKSRARGVKLIVYDSLDTRDFYRLVNQSEYNGIILDLLEDEIDKMDMSEIKKNHDGPIFFMTDNPYPGRVGFDIEFCFNPNQSERLYSTKDLDATKRYFGLKYFLAHESFLKNRIAKKYDGSAKTIMVMMGSSTDNQGHTLILNALRLLRSKISILYAFSLSFDHNERISVYAKGMNHQLDFFKNLTPGVLAQLMNRSDIFIGSAGNASYEASIMGLPVVALNQVDRQNANAAAMAGLGAFVNLGMVQQVPPMAIAITIENLLNSPRRRKLLGETGREIVDGKGLDRVAHIIKKAI